MTYSKFGFADILQGRGTGIEQLAAWADVDLDIIDRMILSQPVTRKQAEAVLAILSYKSPLIYNLDTVQVELTTTM